MHYSKPVQEALNFINEHLTIDISLEALATHVHFSPYHFHRLFLLSAGETPMEYIRRQRLRSASQDLVSNRFSIIEIAAKFRFESQDGFCRAFKKYYGVTPGEYRKLNFNKQTYSARLNEEAKTAMYDMNIYERLACSNDDKKEALSTIDKVLQLSEKVKISGILALEQEIDIVESEFFKKSIQLLIDGVEPEALKEILLNYTLCGDHRGKELLIRVLIIEGILAIQQGVHPLIIREKLSSFFGEDFISEICRHFGLDSESQLKKIESFISVYQDKPTRSKETSLLEEPLGRMVNRSLQRLLREIDKYTLVTAISGSSGKIQAKVLKSVSKKLAIMLIDEMDAIDAPNVSEIVDSQKHVLETMHSLRDQGDIVI